MRRTGIDYCNHLRKLTSGHFKSGLMGVNLCPVVIKIEVVYRVLYQSLTVISQKCQFVPAVCTCLLTVINYVHNNYVPAYTRLHAY